MADISNLNTQKRQLIFVKTDSNEHLLAITGLGIESTGTGLGLFSLFCIFMTNCMYMNLDKLRSQ